MSILEEKEKFLKELEDLIDNSKKINNLNKEAWHDFIDFIRQSWQEGYKQLIEGTIRKIRDPIKPSQELLAKKIDGAVKKI